MSKDLINEILEEVGLESIFSETEVKQPEPPAGLDTYPVQCPVKKIWQDRVYLGR